MVGFRPGVKHFFNFLYFIFATNICGFYLAQLVSALAPSAAVAVTIFPTIVLFFLGFAGYVIYIPDFPTFLRVWGPWIGFCRYAFQGLTLNEFQNNPNLPYSEFWLTEVLGFNTLTMMQCGGIMIAFMLLIALLHLCALKCINFERR